MFGYQLKRKEIFKNYVFKYGSTPSPPHRLGVDLGVDCRKYDRGGANKIMHETPRKAPLTSKDTGANRLSQ